MGTNRRLRSRLTTMFCPNAWMSRRFGGNRWQNSWEPSIHEVLSNHVQSEPGSSMYLLDEWLKNVQDPDWNRVEVPSIRNVFGFKLNTKHLERKKVCTMAFTPTDYSTITDGQIWIMGTSLVLHLSHIGSCDPCCCGSFSWFSDIFWASSYPLSLCDPGLTSFKLSWTVKRRARPLFYEYTAHYERGGGSEDQVAMAFTRQDQEECGQCKGMKIVRSQSLIAEAAEGGAEGGRATSLNVLSHQPIVRNLTGVKFIWGHYCTAGQAGKSDSSSVRQSQPVPAVIRNDSDSTGQAAIQKL